VLRGLTFEYSNSCRSSGAVSISGNASNVLLDTLTIQWNNAQGLNITNPFTNYTVQNTISNHNGDSGFQEYQTLNGLWTNDTANFNNWRGAQGGYYACNVGGHHPFQSHVDTLNGMTYAYNQSYGIHWDTDNANDSATNLTSTNNLVGSAFSEKNAICAMAMRCSAPAVWPSATLPTFPSPTAPSLIIHPRRSWSSATRGESKSPTGKLVSRSISSPTTSPSRVTS
jgi:hypothetical protein